MRRFPAFFTILLLAAFGAQGQSQALSIRGRLLSQEASPVKDAMLRLYRGHDSALLKIESSDDSGRYLFEQLPAGAYFMRVQATGFEPYESLPLLVDQDLDLQAVALRKRNATLQEAVVTGAQPLIRREGDKTVVNVAASLQAAGNTAFDVLRQAPGVNIDQNDNISMRGRPGIMVMIDGKRIFMSGPELANLLRGTAANAIDRIELITNPSARYDAQGAGIINIRMKKEKRAGSNGTLTGSFGHGQAPKAAAGISLNQRTAALNLFGSYNYNYRGEFNDLRLERSFFQQDAFTGAYRQNNQFFHKNSSHNVRIGADYNIGPRTVLGVVGGGMRFDGDRTNDNSSQVYDAQRVYTSSFLTSGDNTLGRSNAFGNLNLKHSFDSSGTELTADLDIARYGSNDRQDYTTRYFDVAGRPLRDPYLLHGDLLGALNIYSLKTDFTRSIGKGLKLDAGIKSSLVAADNDLKFHDRSNGGDQLDTTKSNHFRYDENINAAYVNLAGTRGKIDWQAGLRAENTNATGLQLSNGERFNRSYTQLFPNLNVNYHLHRKHDLGLSLSRRINRPTYNQLNPFKYFLDPSTYAAGNPYLNPELSVVSELSYTYDQRFIAQLSYSRTTQNMITVLIPVPGQEKVIIQTDLNGGSLDYYAATFTVPLKAGKWLSSSNTLNLYHALYRGQTANTQLNNGRTTFDINSMNVFTMGKGYAAELNLVYQSPVAYGFMTQEAVGSVSIGLQRQFWDRRASLKLNISDLLWTSQVRVRAEVTGYTEAFHQKRDTRYAMLSFSYRFGKGQSGPARRRTGGMDDERRRAG